MSDERARDSIIVGKIIENCESILQRLDRYNIDENIFVKNADLREMILFPLLQIGELANHLSDSFLETHREIPWSEIVGMRHIVVHGYGTIDAHWAWATISSDIPVLKEYCANISSL